MRLLVPLEKRTFVKIFMGILLIYSLVFTLTNLYEPEPAYAVTCTNHWCCGTVGCDVCCGCVYQPFSGGVICTNCDGGATTMYCCLGLCRDCTPPECPTGYSTTNTGCSTTSTSCTKTYCNGSSCGSSSRTCWLVKHTVSYDANGGTCTPTSRVLCRGSAADAPSCSRTNYNLTGFTKTAGTCTLTPSTGYCSNVTSDVTIQANWAIKTYVVSYNANGGTCTPTSRTVDHGSSAAGPSCSREGYNLTGFTITSGGCAGTFTPSTGACSSVTQAMTIQANWAIKTYLVSYDANGGTCTPTSRTVDHGSSAAGPSCSREGYNLTGFTITSGACGGTFTSSTGACSGVTQAMTIQANWAIKTYLVSYNANGGTCTPTSRTVDHGSSAAGPSCSRLDYNLTGFTITSGACAGTFTPLTGACSSVTEAMTIQADWEVANSAPTAPTNLLIEDTPSPAVIADTTPYFSAIFNDPDSSDYSEQYQIQINTNDTFTGTTMWDSGLTSMTQTEQGQRSPNINYGGSALSLDGSTYYWKIRMSDRYLLTSPYSAVAQFTMNQAPSTPTYLETEGATDPTCVSDATPEFTAIFNDPDGHSASQYQIQVNTNSSFTGTTMWDSGLTGGINTANATRTDPISYAGTTLTFNGTTYYWRIRFADAYGTVSPWSATANFRMNIPPTTPTQPLTESLVNPIDIGILDPTFSAIFNDPDTCSTIEYSENFEIEVNTASGFTGSVMWDTGQTSMAKTNKGSRSPEITYDGTALSLNGATYYWRIRFWDSVNSVSPWSTTSSFTMETNQTPTAPTGLLVNGITNNPRVNDTNPKFSAIYNDPNQYDFSNYYEIEVNTNETFTGTVMWDSGQQFMSTTTQGARSPNITYNGSTLNLEGVTYYWRIRFWDSANAVSPWATGTFTTAGSYATFQNIQLGGIILDMP